MAGIFKLFLKLKSDLQSIVLTGKSTDCLEGGIVCICSQFSYKVEQLVCLEKKLESAGIDLDSGCDSCRAESLAIFKIECISVLRKGVGTVEVLSLYCSIESIILIECEAEGTGFQSCFRKVFVQFLLNLCRCRSSSRSLQYIFTLQIYRRSCIVPRAFDVTL